MGSNNFTANGTWTVPSTVHTTTRVIVRGWGGGGGGGGGNVNSTSGGAGGGAGGTPGDNVKRILKAAFEEHLKTYDLEDLTGINIYKLLEKAFKEIADRELRSLYDKLPSEPLVTRVVLTNMLVQ